MRHASNPHFKRFLENTGTPAKKTNDIKIHRINSVNRRVKQITYRHIREINLNPGAGGFRSHPATCDLGSESCHLDCCDVTQLVFCPRAFNFFRILSEVPTRFRAASSAYNIRWAWPIWPTMSSVDGSRVARGKLTQWHWSGAVFCPAC